MNRITKNLVLENSTMSSAFYNIKYNKMNINFLSGDTYMINEGQFFLLEVRSFDYAKSVLLYS